MVETFNITTTYGTEECCHLCAATQSGPMNYSNFSHAAPFFDAPRLTEDFLLRPETAMAPLCQLPGWHLESCMIDCMHAGPRKGVKP